LVFVAKVKSLKTALVLGIGLELELLRSDSELRVRVINSKWQLGFRVTVRYWCKCPQ